MKEKLTKKPWDCFCLVLRSRCVNIMKKHIIVLSCYPDVHNLINSKATGTKKRKSDAKSKRCPKMSHAKSKKLLRNGRWRVLTRRGGGGYESPPHIGEATLYWFLIFIIFQVKIYKYPNLKKWPNIILKFLVIKKKRENEWQIKNKKILKP